MKLVRFSIFFLFLSYIIFYLDSSGLGQKLKWFSVFFLLFSLFLQFRKGVPKKVIPKIHMWIWLIVFDILGLITSIYFDILSNSLSTLIGLNFYFLIFYLVAHSIQKDDNELIRVNKIIIITSAILVIFAFVINLPLTLSQFHTYFYGRIRIYGIFQHPNYLGGVCFISLLACFINLKLTNEYKKTYIITILLFLTFLKFSDSRGGMYSFIIFLIVYYLLTFVNKFKNPFLRLFIFSFTFSLVILTLVLSENFASSILGNDDLLNDFTSGRVDNWRFLMDNFILKDHFILLFGHGFSSVLYLVNIGLNTDNGYVVWLFEAGLLNLIMIISLLLYLFFTTLRSKEWNVFGIAIFSSYATYAFFENFLMNFGHIVPFYCWTMLFLSLFAKKRNMYV